MAGLITAAIYNVNRNPRKKATPFQPGDFKLAFTTEAHGSDGAEERVKAMWEWMKAMYGKTE
ncbi:MAG TPA: hypothetical protein VFF78_04680 [Anaerolineaceae bacterium]|nr:hypothetical protein [Anaerolineaceae bacterium]